MSEARRLLERLTAEEAMSYPVDHGNPPDLPTVGNELHCDYCDANVDHDGPHKADCPWAEARAYLAQPMTKCEEREGERVAAMEELRDFGVELQAHGVTEDAIVGLKVENLALAALGEKA